MNNLLRIIVLIGAIILPLKMLPVIGGVGDFNICTNICAGSDVSCRNQNLKCGSSSEGEGILESLLNSYADTGNKFHDWKSVNSVPKQEEGEIKSDKEVSFQLPALGQKKILTFKSSQGKYANKTTEVLFVSFDLMGTKYPTNTPKELKSMIEVFKKANADNPIVFKSMVRIFGRVEGQTSWFDAGPINLSIKPNEKGFMLKITIKPDGKIVIHQSEILNQTGPTGSKITLQEIVLEFGQAI
jgi:hypothetical protein